MNTDVLIIVLAIAAAWSMGHHYAGAVVGPAYGAQVIKMYVGIVLAGICVMVGAVVTSVVATYVNLAPLAGIYAAMALLSLVIMANVTTYLKVPTSTIQLYAFSVIGAALAAGTPVNFLLLGILAIGWVTSPIVSYFLSRGIHKVMPESQHLKPIIIAILCYSGLVLGLNDVSNAASSMVSAGYDVLLAKAICGASMFVGMLVWGSRLIRRVGEELITMDPRIAVSAQLTKSIIISALNVFGLNASMNQATVSALASLGAKKDVLKSIFLGWFYSPVIGFVVAFTLSWIARIYWV